MICRVGIMCMIANIFSSMRRAESLSHCHRYISPSEATLLSHCHQYIFPITSLSSVHFPHCHWYISLPPLPPTVSLSSVHFPHWGDPTVSLLSVMITNQNGQSRETTIDQKKKKKTQKIYKNLITVNPGSCGNALTSMLKCWLSCHGLHFAWNRNWKIDRSS